MIQVANAQSPQAIKTIVGWRRGASAQRKNDQQYCEALHRDA
jgi:hypothetical protein